MIQIETRIQMLKQILETALRPGVSLTMTFASDLAPVHTDAREFETAVLNMVINARDAMPEGGVIALSGDTAERSWTGAEGNIQKRSFTVVSVTDTGAGIDPSISGNIFEPFYTTKSIEKGSGLGLSQVYGFATRSGGDVLVESKPGMGSCFALYLPCAET